MKRLYFIIFFILLMSLCLVGCRVQTPILSPGKISVFNESPVNCTEYIQGNIYYNNVSLKIQVCDGTNWGDV